jgi:hypothetical protein
VGFGPIQLGNLPIGHFRYLTPEEIEKVKTLKVKAENKKSIVRSAEKTRREFGVQSSEIKITRKLE